MTSQFGLYYRLRVSFRKNLRLAAGGCPCRRATWLPILFALVFSAKFSSAENLLLISVDTLRADRLSCYGYRGNRTSNIDRWASEGIRFENVYSEVPLTLPSHCTLLTGTLPFYHGVRDNVGFVLPESQITLAEILRNRGYATGAFIGAYVLASRFGTRQGFDTFDETFRSPEDNVFSPSALRRSAAEVTEKFLLWLQGHHSSNFFAWVHFYDPHAPYAGSYDQQVTQVDQSIGEIDRALRRWNLRDSTHVFFVADHGESLGEHGESAHGFFIYDSTLRIPWIILPAGSFTQRHRVVAGRFSLVDAMPTALQLLNIPLPAHLQGASAVGAVLGKPSGHRPLYAESYLAHLQFGWSPLGSLRLDHYKLIEAPRPELYDLASDAGEKSNLYSSRRVLADRLRARLRELVDKYQPKDPDAAKVRIDPETAQKLAALGYVALSSAAPVKAKSSSGIDPKDRIAIFEQYNQVLAELQQGSSREILDRIAQLRKQDPTFRSLSYLEALAWERAGDLTRAVGSYQRVLEQNPDNNLARANLANLHLRIGRRDLAKRELQQILARDPADYRSRNNLGLIYRSEGDLNASLNELRKVIETNAQYATGWLNLGSALAQMKQLAEAERAFRRAIEIDYENVMAHRYLARALHDQDRQDEARAEMQLAAELEARLRKK